MSNNWINPEPCFPPGQARLDGAFCEYSEEDKIEYLRWLSENEVANIEMESTVFASLTHRAGEKLRP